MLQLFKGYLFQFYFIYISKVLFLRLTQNMNLKVNLAHRTLQHLIKPQYLEAHNRNLPLDKLGIIYF